MSITYLIDGYNLIHALGMIRKHAGAGGLEAARTQLLEFLANAFGDDAHFVMVVFDAKRAPRGVERTQSHRGIAVRFAAKNESADDMIEELIQEHATPKTLVVVSNDLRLQNAASRRGARGWSHETFLDQLEKTNAAKAQSSTGTEKKDSVSPEEAKRWLREFENLEADPTLKENFDHNRFE